MALYYISSGSSLFAKVLIQGVVVVGVLPTCTHAFINSSPCRLTPNFERLSLRELEFDHCIGLSFANRYSSKSSKVVMLMLLFMLLLLPLCMEILCCVLVVWCDSWCLSGLAFKLLRKRELVALL